MSSATTSNSRKSKKPKPMKAYKKPYDQDGEKPGKAGKEKHTVSRSDYIKVGNNKEDCAPGSIAAFFQRLSDETKQGKNCIAIEQATNKKFHHVKDKKQSNMKKAKAETKEVTIKHSKSDAESKDLKDVSISEKHKSKKHKSNKHNNEDEEQNSRSDIQIPNSSNNNHNLLIKKNHAKDKKLSNMKKDKAERKKMSIKHNKSVTPDAERINLKDVSISKKHKSKKHKTTKHNSENEEQNAEINIQIPTSSNKNHKLSIKKNKTDKPLLQNDKGLIKNSDHIVINEAMPIAEVTSEEINNSAKLVKNAFSVMMDNRHKVIGHNSPGKEAEQVEESQNLQKEIREKLSTRKALFQNWADSKGAKKRKLVDDELGTTIDYKLKQRAKRFKKMLEVTEHSAVDSGKDTVIERGSETTQSVKEVQNNNSNDNDDVILIKHETKFTECVEIKPSSECNISLDYKETNVKKSMHQTDLSSFFGTLDKNKRAIDKNSKELVKSKSYKKNSKDTDLNNTSITVDLSNNFHEIEDQIDNATPRTRKKWKMRLRLSLDEIGVETFENLVDAHVSSNKRSASNKKNPLKPINGNNSINSFDNSELHNGVKSTNRNSKEFNKREKQLEHDLVTESMSIIDISTDSDHKPLEKKQRNMQSNHACKKKSDTTVKIAPVFLKSVPKPKVDKQILTARKKFLASGIPDELKKFQEKQQKLLNRSCPIFPTISHIMVQPNEEQKNNPTNFWNLPCVALDLKQNTTFTLESSTLKLGMLTNSTSTESINNKFLPDIVKVINIKEEIQKLKNENPNYPVYKSFRLCSDAHFNSIAIKQDSPKKSKKSTKWHSRSKSQVDVTKSKSEPVHYKLWTDLYKPRSSDEMYSNYSNVKLIKRWLQMWLEFSFDTKKNKRKRKLSDSSSDFENTDVYSTDRTSSLRNTLILSGPHGSGKTSAVHALCLELGIVVLESNASSKRTGKVLLQQLQQVAQSQELQGVVQDFLTTDNIKSSPKRMHVLLIEDVDIVFDQDESFLSAVNQLIGRSRLPVILTTTDLNSLHLRKFISVHTVIEFTAVSPKVLAPWLQILCLVEGACVKKQLVTELLLEYKGDVRSTLLQLQFLVQSVGNAKVDSHSLKNVISGINDKDELNIFLYTKDQNDAEEDVHDYIDGIIGKTSDTLTPLDLGQIWWNIPQLLNMPSPVLYLYQMNSIETNQINQTNSENNIQTDTILETAQLDEESLQNVLDSAALLEISDIFNAAAMTDLFYNGMVDCDLEPVHKKKSTKLKGSLEETSSLDSCYFHRDLVVEMSHILVKGYITSRGTPSNLKLYRGLDEKRWRSKQYKCGEKFLETVPLTHHLDSTALADYLSTLRTIAKSESDRESTNSKRRNRFYNYLSGLGVSLNDSILKTANNAFFSDS